MSVLLCNRRGCNNTYDRVSSEHGYICDDCFDELIAKIKTVIETTIWIDYVNNEFKLIK